MARRTGAVQPLHEQDGQLYRMYPVYVMDDIGLTCQIKDKRCLLHLAIR